MRPCSRLGQSQSTNKFVYLRNKNASQVLRVESQIFFYDQIVYDLCEIIVSWEFQLISLNYKLNTGWRGSVHA